MVVLSDLFCCFLLWWLWSRIPVLEELLWWILCLQPLVVVPSLVEVLPLLVEVPVEMVELLWVLWLLLVVPLPVRIGNL